jgi:hypothetical protein
MPNTSDHDVVGKLVDRKEVLLSEIKDLLENQQK